METMNNFETPTLGDTPQNDNHQRQSVADWPEQTTLPGADSSNRRTFAGRSKRARRYLLIAVNILPALVGLAFYYTRFIAPFESTDDAFIEAHVTPVAPQVAGRVSNVLVRD